MLTNPFHCRHSLVALGEFCLLKPPRLVYTLSPHVLRQYNGGIRLRRSRTWPMGRGSRLLKKSVGIGIGVVGLAIGTLLIVPAFVDWSIFKRTYLPIIEEAIHRRVDVSEVRLSLVPTPSIRLSNLRVSDSPAFPDNIFFAARQLQLRLKLWPLLRGRFEVTEFVLEKPVINLLKKPDGTFNYADLADKEIPLEK